jgi:hypothetical protein
LVTGAASDARLKRQNINNKAVRWIRVSNPAKRSHDIKILAGVFRAALFEAGEFIMPGALCWHGGLLKRNRPCILIRPFCPPSSDALCIILEEIIALSLGNGLQETKKP